MNTPTAGSRLTASDGTVFLIESITDLTSDPDFQPGDDRFILQMVEAPDAAETGAIGHELMESEFIAFCAQEGIKQPA